MDSVVKWKPSEIDSMLKLAKRVATLQEDIPCREGMPLGYIDSVELAKLSASDDPSQAIVPISFLEGFPTVNGVPIWERLDGEPLDMYDLFRAYLNLPATDGKRTFSVIARRAGIDVRAVNAVALLWHWAARAAAYDQFKEQEREYIRRHEVRRMENKHAKAAEKIFDTCLQFIEKHHAELTTKTALEWFRMGVELHRLSLGLQKDRPEGASDNDGGGGHVININQTVTPAGASIGGVATQEQEKGRIFEILSVLKQTGVLTYKTEGEVIDVEPDDDQRGIEAAEGDYDTTHEQIHGGVPDTETGSVPSAG